MPPAPKHMVLTLTRSKLEQLTGDLVAHSLDPVRQAIKDAGLKAADINEVRHGRRDDPYALRARSRAARIWQGAPQRASSR